MPGAGSSVGSFDRLLDGRLFNGEWLDGSVVQWPLARWLLVQGHWLERRHDRLDLGALVVKAGQLGEAFKQLREPRAGLGAGNFRRFRWLLFVDRPDHFCWHDGFGGLPLFFRHDFFRHFVGLFDLSRTSIGRRFKVVGSDGRVLVSIRAPVFRPRVLRLFSDSSPAELQHRQPWAPRRSRRHRHSRPTRRWN